MLARSGQTLVLYMAISRLTDICARLIEHGLPPQTPAGVIERGTTDAQRVCVGTLADLPAKAREYGIRPPALTVIGGVVGLYPRLEWFRPSGDGAREAPHAGCAGVDRGRDQG
jgi:uroporphyrin-III C-methyltransferase